MTSYCNFARLGQNLDAISRAFREPAQLIPNSFNTEFALATSLQGAFWKGMLTSARTIGLTKDSIEQKQKQTLQAIMDQFHCAIAGMEIIDSQYRLRLIAPNSSQELAELKSKIILIGQRLRVLFSMCSPLPLTDRLKLINQVYQKYSFDSVVDDAEQRTLHRMSLDHAMCMAELRLGRPYPFAAFNKILGRQTLQPDEERELNEWIEKIQRPSSYISVGLLHAALQGCVELLLKDLSPESDEFLDKLSSLEWRLISGKASLLEENDPDHLLWVRSLVARDSYENRDLTIFEQENQRLIVCGKNRSHVGVWRAVCTHFAWSIQPVDCLFQDPHGRFCIIEKVDYCLEDVVISKTDTALLNELARLLEFWATHSFIPKKISCQDIFVKVKGDDLILKVLSPMLCTDAIPGDYNRLETFCFLFAKGNLDVFAYLMKQSRLAEHPVAIAYETTALKMLTGQSNIETELALYDISDPEVLDHAQKLVEALKNAQGELFERLRTRLKAGKPEAPLFAAIARALVSMQKEGGFFSRAHPDIKKPELLDKLESTVVATHRAMFI